MLELIIILYNSRTYGYLCVLSMLISNSQTFSSQFSIQLTNYNGQTLLYISISQTVNNREFSILIFYMLFCFVVERYLLCQASESIEVQPACDTRFQQWATLCNLLQARRQLAYRGFCKVNTRRHACQQPFSFQQL